MIHDYTHTHTHTLRTQVLMKLVYLFEVLLDSIKQIVVGFPCLFRSLMSFGGQVIAGKAPVFSCLSVGGLVCSKNVPRSRSLSLSVIW